jgi:hypothetical protein
MQATETMQHAIPIFQGKVISIPEVISTVLALLNLNPILFAICNFIE